MANQHRIGKHATSITKGGDILKVKYHNTNVVTVNRLTGEVILDTGGWETVTTKTRMNQTARQFGFGFHVYQKDFDWFVGLPTGDTIPFDGNIVTFNYK
jgi:hypothetical protein